MSTEEAQLHKRGPSVRVKGSRRDRKDWKRRRRRKKLKEKNQKSYEEVFTFNNLYNAGIKSCKNVRWKASTIDFESNIIVEVQRLLNRLHRDGYRFQGFRYFRTVEHGKMRDINALTIQDRTVQRCFCDQIMTKNYADSFIFDNSASLPKKGMDLSLKRLKRFLQEHYRKYGLGGGILQFDFKSFFASIPHDKAKTHVRNYIKDKKLQKLLYQLIDDFNTMGGTHPINKGVGLGSQVSQNIALEYPNEIDHHFKDRLGIRGFGRYMDDGYIIHHDMKYLNFLKSELYRLAKKLGIKMSDKKTQIVPFKSHSFKFLKFRYRISKTGKVSMQVNRNSIKNMRRKIRAFKRKLEEGIMAFDDILSSFQSWRAHCKRGNCFRTLVNMDRYFCTVFSEELRTYRLQFKCTLKATLKKDGYHYHTNFLTKDDKMRGFRYAA